MKGKEECSVNGKSIEKGNEKKGRNRMVERRRIKGKESWKE